MFAALCLRFICFRKHAILATKPTRILSLPCSRLPEKWSENLKTCQFVRFFPQLCKVKRIFYSSSIASSQLAHPLTYKEKYCYEFKFRFSEVTSCSIGLLTCHMAATDGKNPNALVEFFSIQSLSLHVQKMITSTNERVRQLLLGL